MQHRFPTRWLTFIMIVELLMIALSVLLIGYAEVRLREGLGRQVRLERLHGDIGYLDEVLTMSTRMAAASGDRQWETRYLEHETKLDTKIQEVMSEAQILKLDLTELGISTTNDANRRLVVIEKRAFEHVRKGNTDKARQLLSSDSYLENKRLYAQGLDKLLTRLDSLVTLLVSAQKNRVQIAQLTSVLGWFLLVVIWLVVLRSIRTWRNTRIETQTKIANYQLHLEQRLASMTKQLTRAEHLERQRIAGLLHDQLQQLLVASRLHLSVLPTSSPKDQVNQLLEQSIDLSRSLTNELNPPGLMMSNFGDAIKWLAHWSTENHGLELTLEVCDELPNADPETKVIAFDAIREILFNISKHAQVDRAEIRVDVSQSNDVIIEVIDEGIGFDPDLIESGDRFGLLNTRRRLELIGGSFEVRSQINKGSRARITLPNRCLLQADRNLSGFDTASQHQPSKVLIVDDHPIVRAGLLDVLRRLPAVEFREASGFEEVCDVLIDFTPNVAIVDISLGSDLPDGFEVTRFLRSKFEDIRVIAFTSYDDPNNRQKMAEAGAAHYLVKGGDPIDLLDAIRA